MAEMMSRQLRAGFANACSVSSYSGASGYHATPARLACQSLADPCRSLAGEALVDPVLANGSPTREPSCPSAERLARRLHDKTVRMQPCERAAAASRRRAQSFTAPKKPLFNGLFCGFIFVRHLLPVEYKLVHGWFTLKLFCNLIRNRKRM